MQRGWHKLTLSSILIPRMICPPHTSDPLTMAFESGIAVKMSSFVEVRKEEHFNTRNSHDCYMINVQEL